MAKKCFLSFHYEADNWRVSKVANMGVVEEQPILARNKWEEIANQGNAAIEQWIETNLRGKEALVVLIGRDTASRPWVQYEIARACAHKRMGILGIHIHKITDRYDQQTSKGSDPFRGVRANGNLISDYARTYDPSGNSSPEVYASISSNIERWVDAAISLRSQY